MNADSSIVSRQYIPEADLPQLAKLAPDVRSEVMTLLQIIDRIGVDLSITAACERAGHLLGRSWKGIYHRIHQFQASKDWRSLLDKARAGSSYWNSSGAVTLPPKFRDYVESQWAMNQRGKFRSVHTALLYQWRQWSQGDETKAIPGYSTPPQPDPRTDIPVGWTYSNLRRCCMPSKYARKLIQMGPKAASQFGPLVLRTRVGLEPGQYYIIDDYWNDFKVLAPGARQACRLLQYDVLDIFSGCDIARGFKPALQDEDGTKVHLKEQEVVWLLCHTFCNIGYRAAGTTINAEAGAATVRQREQDLLEQLSRGRIHVRIGPCTGEAKLAGFFDGSSGGNPRFKAPLESLWNLAHNQCANLIEFPGQTGSNSRLNKPEELTGRERHTSALIRAALALPEDRAAELRYDFLGLYDAIAAITAIFDRINQRENHDLEGWRKSGLYVREWRPAIDWPFMGINSLAQYLDQKDPAERVQMMDYILSTPNLTRERPLSPHEVFSAARPGLVRLPLSAGAILMNDLPGLEVSVRNTRLEFTNTEIDPDEPLRFEALRRDGNGTEELLQDGSKWLVRVNPLWPKTAYLFDAKNGFAGACRNIGRVSWADNEGLKRAFGRRNHIEAKLIADAQRIANPILRIEAEKRAHNAAIFMGADERINAATSKRASCAEGREALEAILDPMGSKQETPVAGTTGAGDQADDFLNTISEP
ncbi:MAG TPA: hypothetical protein DCZ69_02665 [Syntrophobacteraceae bacterium]|nr:hypothetical protein [Syntrophobacteraceae bacterium]